MANSHHVQRVGAHSNQETRPCDSSSPGPTVAPDSQSPPTGRKRKHRTLAPEQQDSQKLQHKHRRRRRQNSDSSWDRAELVYWDSLSRVWLAPDALREFDRRNALLAAESSQEDRKVEPRGLPSDIKEFARHGGPDLTDIRQYSDSSENSTVVESMPSRAGKKNSGEGRSGDVEKPRRSSAYTPNFEQILADKGIYLAKDSPEPANFREWHDIVKQPRPSLSPSRMSDGDWRRFRKAARGAENEDEVMSHVFPKIVGDSPYSSRQNAKFGNLDPLVPNIVTPQPDYYQGHPPGVGNRQLRRQLDTSIVPSSKNHYPFLPNFFAEAKSPEGTFKLGQLQVCHDGAVGALATHRVHNLGRTEEVFDNRARTASALYHGEGNIALYTHHLSKPRGRGTPSQTHMTYLRSYDIADNPENFRQGVGAFRNASDYAHRHRVEAIEDAHRRNRIVTPEPATAVRRSARRPLSCQSARSTRRPLSCQSSTSTRRPLSCQASVVKSSDSDPSSSSEEDSEDEIYRESSGARSKGRVLNPEIAIATPKRPATRSPPSGPLTRRRKAMVADDSYPSSSSGEESSKAPRGRQLPKPEIIAIAPRRASRREPSPPRKNLRPRR